MVIANPGWMTKLLWKQMYDRLLAELDKAEYTSDAERQLVRKHVEAAWKKVEKDMKGFIPPIIATLT